MLTEHTVVIGRDRDRVRVVVPAGRVMLLDPAPTLDVGQVLAAHDVWMNAGQCERIILVAPRYRAPRVASPQRSKALLAPLGQLLVLVAERAHGW